MLYDDLTAIVKRKQTKVNLTDNEIWFALEEVEAVIKNYCQISEVPAALKFTWCNMCVDLLLYQYEANVKPEDLIVEVDAGAVSDVKVGDTSISFSDGSGSGTRGRNLKSHNSNLDSIVMNYRAQLNQFRRIL